MSDVINRDFAVMAIEQWLDHDGGWFELGLKQAVREIKRLPSADRPQGEWKITDAWPHNVYCSECYKTFAQTRWEVWEDGSLPRKFCPNCGARMKGADDE